MPSFTFMPPASSCRCSLAVERARGAALRSRLAQRRDRELPAGRCGREPQRCRGRPIRQRRMWPARVPHGPDERAQFQQRERSTGLRRCRRQVPWLADPLLCRCPFLGVRAMTASCVAVRDSHRRIQGRSNVRQRRPASRSCTPTTRRISWTRSTWSPRACSSGGCHLPGGWTLQSLMDGGMTVSGHCHNPRCHHPPNST